MAKTYYVSPSGNNKSLGTFAQPFRTIQKAAELAQPGDTVYIRGGVYRERVRPVNSGNPGAPITYKAYEDETVTIRGTRELTPGKNGLSQWQPHKLPNGKTIHKIQLPEKWVRFDDGRNQIFVNGQMMTEARWPNVPDPVELERDDYAISTDGSVGSKRSNGLFNATYNHPGIESFWKGGYIGFNAGVEWIGSSSRVLGASKGKVNFETRIKSTHGPFVENPYSPTADDPFYLWGKLEALDTAEEWFIDKEGEYGPANMLYLWSPDGNPANQTVEIRNRYEVWDFTDRSYIRVEDLNFFAGKVRSLKGSKNLVLDGIISEYGEHTLAAGGDPAIRLQGSNHKLLNSEISKTALTGVIVQGDDHLVQNNIVRDIGYGIHSIGDGIRVINGTGTDILHNTVYNIGDRGIFFSGLKDGKIKYNDVFEAGKQRTDLAGIETYGGGDGQGTEIAYNWVHDIEPVKNLESQHFGGQGIRLDPGNKGTSNYKIHHNLVWDTSSGQSIEVWSLKPNMPNYGNSGIDIYNNTVESDIRLFGAKGTSHGGTTVKNNIAGRANTAGGSKEGNAFENNLEASENPQLVNPKKNDFRLQPSSPAIDAAKPIAGVSNNVPDGKPDVGALEFGQAPFKAGAIIMNEHLDALNLSITPSEEPGLVEVRVSNLPANRKLPANFKLKIGDKTIGQEALENFSYSNKTATLYYRNSAFAGVDNTRPVRVQIGSGSTVVVDVKAFDLGRNNASSPNPSAQPELTAIGEFGTVTNFNHQSQTILLDRSYVNPVVFAQPLSRKGADPSIVRITDIQSDRFSVYLQEANYKDGWHTQESFSYFVAESGTWQLEDGTLLEVDTLNTNVMTTSSWETIDFSTSFDTAPVILSQVQTDNGRDFVRTRQRYATADGFRLAMEEEEALRDSGHRTEKLGWLAISPGQGSGNGLTYQAGSTGDKVTHNWHTLNFSQNFQQAPHLLASIATYDGGDSVGLRYQNLTKAGVQLMAEEDASRDSETDHTTEVVNFLAFEGDELMATAYDPLTGASASAAPVADPTDMLLSESYDVQHSAAVEAEVDLKSSQDDLVGSDAIGYEILAGSGGLPGETVQAKNGLDELSGNTNGVASLSLNSSILNFV